MTRTIKRAELALHKRLAYADEMRRWPYCEWQYCHRPAMEVIELCLASDGERLLRPFHCCSVHADALPLPLYSRIAPPAIGDDDGYGSG